jgi:acylphosphatase
VIRRRVTIYGYVQGVYFRESARRRAELAGIRGWVRNNPDGSVEAVFEGAPKAVERLLAFCERGPRGAVVDRVDVVSEEPQGLRGFEIAR